VSSNRKVGEACLWRCHMQGEQRNGSYSSRERVV